MHTLLFSIKRSHLRAVREGHGLLRRFGITPARFDMLFAIRECRCGVISQRELRRELGVAHATVSRMLKSLEGLGLVQRGIWGRDRRTRSVWLTDKGKSRIRQAAWMAIGKGTVEYYVGCALTAEWWSEARKRTKMRELETLLVSFRRYFDDVARLRYPPLPGEVEEPKKKLWKFEVPRAEDVENLVEQEFPAEMFPALRG